MIGVGIDGVLRGSLLGRRAGTRDEDDNVLIGVGRLFPSI